MWYPARWSLRSRLLAGQVLLLVAVVVGIAAASEVALRQFLIQQLDRQMIDLQDRSLMDVGGGPRLGPRPSEPPTSAVATEPESVPPSHELEPVAPTNAPTLDPEPTPSGPDAMRPQQQLDQYGPVGGKQRDEQPQGPNDSNSDPNGPAAPRGPGTQPRSGKPGPSRGGGEVSTHPAQVSDVPSTPPVKSSSGPAPAFLDRGGIQSGTVGAVFELGTPLAAGLIGTDGTQNRLSAKAEQQLAAVPADGKPTTVTLEGAGRYRVMADPTWDGTIVVTGLPMSGVDAILLRGLLISVIVTIVALTVAITVGVWLIRRALTPLERVSATAARVAGLTLDRGEVELPVRVPSVDSCRGTEVGQLGAAVNRMLDHITDALSARHASETRARQFLADASHELRTPLAAIRGYAELAQRSSCDVPVQVADAMDRVDAAARRMSDLVEDMLLLARLDAGRPLDCEPVDLSQLTVDAISDAHVAGPDHHWDLDLPDEPVVVAGDSLRLHQVLANLLTNARVHTPAGTTVTVSLELDTHSGVTWRVSDDGPGISEELQPEVFQRFARGDSSRSRHAGGTGLGLAIVAAVVKAHSGEITVDSVPGRTEFAVRLPDKPSD
ncbi:ATP-binding protein [Nocardia sp. NPDC059246]|uniref:ATP-binding protein n=1 Tax=Nocardia sp. NPDC059246 TaxID=3346789 RepID=UPI003683176B